MLRRSPLIQAVLRERVSPKSRKIWQGPQPPSRMNKPVPDTSNSVLFSIASRVKAVSKKNGFWHPQGSCQVHHSEAAAEAALPAPTGKGEAEARSGAHCCVFAFGLVFQLSRVPFLGWCQRQAKRKPIFFLGIPTPFCHRPSFETIALPRAVWQRFVESCRSLGG